MSTPWTYLLLAGLLEICWTAGLKHSDGFTRPWPSLFTLTALAASMFLLAKAAQELPIGTAYAVWVGIGALGAAVVGFVLFDETMSAVRLGFLCLLIVSILGLRFTSS